MMCIYLIACQFLLFSSRLTARWTGRNIRLRTLLGNPCQACLVNFENWKIALTTRKQPILVAAEKERKSTQTRRRDEINARFWIIRYVCMWCFENTHQTHPHHHTHTHTKEAIYIVNWPLFLLLFFSPITDEWMQHKTPPPPTYTYCQLSFPKSSVRRAASLFLSLSLSSPLFSWCCPFQSTRCPLMPPSAARPSARPCLSISTRHRP